MTRQKLGKYEILEEVGSGGFGIVYRAFDPSLHREVAIKTCRTDDEEQIRRFTKEAQIVGSLHHPNITMVHEYGVHEGTPYLVQEFLTGEDLADVIRRGARLSFASKIDYLVQITRGLAVAHGRGVVHRDIKPANIRILEDGTVKIMDFGLARLVDQKTRLTQTGLIVGTAHYLAPEQITAAPIDARTDIFSFGVLLFELLTSQPPFLGPSLADVLSQIIHQPHRSLGEEWPACPPALERVVDRCLAKRPEDRYQSTSELVRELEALAADAARESEAHPSAPKGALDAPGVPLDPSRGSGLGAPGAGPRAPETPAEPAVRRRTSSPGSSDATLGRGPSRPSRAPRQPVAPPPTRRPATLDELDFRAQLPGAPQPAAPLPAASQPAASQPAAHQPVPRPVARREPSPTPSVPILLVFGVAALVGAAMGWWFLASRSGADGPSHAVASDAVAALEEIPPVVGSEATIGTDGPRPEIREAGAGITARAGETERSGRSVAPGVTESAARPSEREPEPTVGRVSEGPSSRVADPTPTEQTVAAQSELGVAGGSERAVPVPTPVDTEVATRSVAPAGGDDEPVLRVEGPDWPGAVTDATPRDEPAEARPSTQAPPEEDVSGRPLGDPGSATLLVARSWSPYMTVRIGDGQAYPLSREWRLPVSAGVHEVVFEVQSPAYHARDEATLTLRAGEIRPLESPILQPGQLVVQARLGSPQGRVWIEGREVGSSPQSLWLAPGAYGVELRGGAGGTETEVTLLPGRRSVVTYDLTQGGAPSYESSPVDGP